MTQNFKVGVVFPQLESGVDPLAIRDFAQAVEELGFSHLLGYDHVIGANTASRPDWKMPYSHVSLFHEPLMLFSFLAGVTTRIGLSTGVLILPQRQTVLVAKQAANLDIFSNGRLRLGVGLGWNEVEYEALGVPFQQRAKRLEDQIAFMRRLWTESAFSYDSAFHRMTDAGINPLPVQRPIPIYLGGIAPTTVDRVARLADGWLPILPASSAREKVAELKSAVETAGRDPALVGLENIVVLSAKPREVARTAEDAVSDTLAWKEAGASGVSFHTMHMRFKSLDDHIAFLRQIAEKLGL
jgi:probable F420-dependent oxidoreductase